uniref:Uncharacterized protein n=1 Tax=Anguilla anguilla TaxID=7936 RepID=A0A0E9UGL3_ANGAN
MSKCPIIGRLWT